MWKVELDNRQRLVMDEAQDERVVLGNGQRLPLGDDQRRFGAAGWQAQGRAALGDGRRRFGAAGQQVR
jgi:hypothetical protein